jgi:hypothetical protein
MRFYETVQINQQDSAPGPAPNTGVPFVVEPPPDLTQFDRMIGAGWAPVTFIPANSGRPGTLGWMLMSKDEPDLSPTERARAAGGHVLGH